jgi:hypothetical protein
MILERWWSQPHRRRQRSQHSSRLVNNSELGTKSVEPLSNGTTLIYHSNKLNFTVKRLILKKIMLSAPKFAFFLVHVYVTMLNFLFIY